MTGGRYYRKGYKHGLDDLERHDKAYLVGVWEACASFPADDYDRGYLAALHGKPCYPDEQLRQRIRRGYWVAVVVLGVLLASLA